MKSSETPGTLKILHEDNHLLAVNKPSGLPSQPDASRDASLIELAKEYIRVAYSRPGDVYLALLHRLDRPTSGLVLLARTDKAAGRMADLFRRRDIEKRYLALVNCHADPGSGGELRNWLAPATSGSMAAVPAKRGEAREARLRYETVAVRPDGKKALLAVDLETGVKHQIRCQLAAVGLPVAGDFRYGAFGKPARPQAVAGGRAVLLHAFRAAFVHPVKKERLVLSAPLPEHWRAPLCAMPKAAEDFLRDAVPGEP